MNKLKIIIQRLLDTIDTKEKKLRYSLKKERMKELIIEGYCDSDYAGDKDTLNSVAGYAIYLFRCLIA